MEASRNALAYEASHRPLNDCCQREVVEQVRKHLPHIRVAVLRWQRGMRASNSVAQQISPCDCPPAQARTLRKHSS